MSEGQGIAEIEIHGMIDCPEYRRILQVIRSLPKDQRLEVIALDLPYTLYRSGWNRDQWIAKSILNAFESNSSARIFVELGNLHMLRKLEWESHVPNKHPSIRQYLADEKPQRRAYPLEVL